MAERITDEQMQYLRSLGHDDVRGRLTHAALAEIEHLRAEVAAAEQRGAAKERVAVVADLRRTATALRIGPEAAGLWCQADRFERGDHVEHLEVKP